MNSLAPPVPYDLALRGLLAIALVVAGAMLLPLTNSAYDLFVDEYYYLACADRLSWGYVDHPPFSIAVLTIWTQVFGDSLLALRTPPILAFSSLIVITGIMAHRLGAKPYVQLLAGGLIPLITAINVIFGFYSMNAFELCFWSLSLLLMIELVRRQNPNYWIALGVLAGLAVLNKHSSAFFYGALFLGLLLSSARSLLWHKQVLWAAGVGLLVVAPHLYWQWQNDWISLEFYHSLDIKNVDTPPLKAIGSQLVSVNIGLVPIILLGLCYLFSTKSMKPYRFIGYGFLLLFSLMIFSNQSRPDRIMGIYPVLIALGVIGLDHWVEHWQRWLAQWQQRLHLNRPVEVVVGWIELIAFKLRLRRLFLFWRQRWLLVSFIGFPVFVFLFALPITHTLLPPNWAAAYGKALGVAPKMQVNEDDSGLPLWLSFRLNWRGPVEAVSDIYQRLSPDEQAHTVVVTADYANSGAVEYYSKDLPLPKAYGAHMSYYLWGPPPADTTTVITTRYTEQQLQPFFADIQLMASVECQYCSAFRQVTPVYLVREPKMGYEEIWLGLRRLY